MTKLFCEASAFSWFSSFSLSKKLEEKCRKKKNEICREELPFLQFFDRFGCRTTIFFFFDFLHLSPSSHRTEKSRKKNQAIRTKTKRLPFLEKGKKKGKLHCETKSLVRIYDYNLSDKQRSRKGSKANPPQWFENLKKVSWIRNVKNLKIWEEISGVLVFDYNIKGEVR